MELNTQKLQAQRLLQTYGVNTIAKSQSEPTTSEAEVDPTSEELVKGNEQSVANLLEYWHVDQKATAIDNLLKAFGSDNCLNSLEKSGRSGLTPQKVAIKGHDGQTYYAIRWLKPNQVAEGANHGQASHDDEHSKPVNETLNGHESARQKIKKLVAQGIYDHKELTKISPNDGHFVRKHLKENGIEPKEFEGHSFDEAGNFKDGNISGRPTGTLGAPVPTQVATQAAESALAGSLATADQRSLADEYGITMEDMWDNYNFAMDMLIEEGSPKSILVYGTGGVGKTYDFEQKVKQHGLRKFEDADDNGEPILMDSEDYDYVTVKGSMSITDLWKTVVQNRKKLIVFDDCDSMWRGGDSNPAKNILKGMLDSTGDGEVTYSGQEVKDEEGNKLPKKIKFKGKVIFISNLDRSAFPQPLVDSRCNALDLSMTMEQTVDKLNAIKNFVKPTNENGERVDGIEQEDKDRAMDFINEFQNRLGIGQVNGRTLAKLMVISKKSRLAGEDNRTFLKRAIHYQNLHKQVA
jgi:hypothetical protein